MWSAVRSALAKHAGRFWHIPVETAGHTSVHGCMLCDCLLITKIEINARLMVGAATFKDAPQVRRARRLLFDFCGLVVTV